MSRAVRRGIVVTAGGCALLVFADLVAAGGLWLRDRVAPAQAVVAHRTDSALTLAYPGWTKRDIRTILAESYRPMEYEPLTGFRPRASSGRFINVSASGFREGGTHDPWPPDSGALNVFVFGGSTTFGTGIRDAETIPARMEAHLGSRCNRVAHVYNFGRDSYYSTQERILFEHLLTERLVPGAAVFIDGLNDGSATGDTPAFSSEFREVFDFMQTRTPWWRGIALAASSTALGRLVRGLRAPRLSPMFADSAAAGRERSRNVERWLASRAMIGGVAKTQGVVPLFVVQPVPVYHYDFAADPFAADARLQLAGVARFYEMLARERSDTAADVLWLADAHPSGSTKTPYVDTMHYAPWFADTIARAITDALVRRLPGACAPHSR